MRMIDADKASEYLKNLFKGYISDGHITIDTVDASAMVQCVIRDTPTVDAEPIARAHWIPLKDLDLCECSVCGRREIHYYGCKESASPEEAFPYCHCGAKMVKEETE